MSRPLKYKTAQEVIDYNSYYCSGTGCHLWKLRLDRGGYAIIKRVHWAKYYNVRMAHQLSYILAYGEYDRDLLICHKCNIRHCVNPKHLYAGTYKSNAQDRSRALSQSGSKNPASKLDEIQVKEIKNLLGTCTVTYIAKLYGVHKDTIQKIKSGKNWGHIGPNFAELTTFKID